MIPEYLQPFVKDSIIKEHKRGMRRYFPISAKRRRGWKYLQETFFIVYGRRPKDRAEIGTAIFFNNLDTYVERFDNKLWVRTICV